MGNYNNQDSESGERRSSNGNRNRSGGSRFGNRSGGGNRGGSRFGGNRGGRFGGGNRGGGSRFNRPREMHKAVCSECKKDCEVPFKPTEGRPVLCSDCFKKQKGF